MRIQETVSCRKKMSVKSSKAYYTYMELNCMWDMHLQNQEISLSEEYEPIGDIREKI